MVYPIKRTFTTTVVIPEGYSVEYLPDPQKIDNTLFHLDFTANKTEKQVTVSFEYYFKQSVYSSKDYSKIKFFFNEIVKKTTEKIVFSKIT